MKSAPLLSSQDGSGRVQLEGFGPTRNRKVVGSNPTSGSISAGEGLSSKTSRFGSIRRWQPEQLNSRHASSDWPPSRNGAAAASGAPRMRDGFLNLRRVEVQVAPDSPGLRAGLWTTRPAC